MRACDRQQLFAQPVRIIAGQAERRCKHARLVASSSKIHLNLYGGIRNNQSFTRKQPRNRATAQPRNRATAQPRNRAISGGTLFFSRGKISGGNFQFQFNRVIFRRKGVATRGNSIRASNNGATIRRNGVRCRNNGASRRFNGAAIQNDGVSFRCLGVNFRCNGAVCRNNGVSPKINGFPLKSAIFANFMVGTTCRSSEAAQQRDPTLWDCGDTSSLSKRGPVLALQTFAKPSTLNLQP
jgi:hypothetical protein